MTETSTTIRVSVGQRDRLRVLAEQQGTSMAVALDQALEALRRENFYRGMAEAERLLRARPSEWSSYVAERDQWLNTDLGSPAA